MTDKKNRFEGFKYIGNIFDMTAHEKISKELQKKKGIDKEQADEEAGKILSAAKAKGKGKKEQESKMTERDKKLFQIGYDRIAKKIKEFEALNYKKEKIIEAIYHYEIKGNPNTPNFNGAKKALEDYKLSATKGKAKGEGKKEQEKSEIDQLKEQMTNLQQKEEKLAKKISAFSQKRMELKSYNIPLDKDPNFTFQEKAEIRKVIKERDKIEQKIDREIKPRLAFLLQQKRGV